MDQTSRWERPDGDAQPAARHAGASDRVYEVRVTGAMSEQVLLQLPGVEVSEQELRTVVSGRFQDQAELHGFLARLRALGLDIVEVRRVAAGTLPDERSVEP